MSDYSIWNYSVLSRFNKNVFGNLITINELKSEYEEMYAKDGYEYTGYYFYVPSDKRLYFFDAVDKDGKHILDQLPIAITNSTKQNYKNRVFYHVTNYDSFKIVPKKIYTFKKIVDELAKLKHSNASNFKDWVLVALASYIDKIMIRISSEAGFGKDSVLRIMGNLLKGVVVAKPRTVAKMEYLLQYSNTMGFNEVGNLNVEQKRLIEDFILQIGDYSGSYEKGSLATKGLSKNKNDLEKLSLVFMYNDLDHYDDPKQFFDKLFNNKAVYDRLLPLRFKGRLDVSQFHNNFQIGDVAKDNQNYFIDILKSIEYYKQFYRMELKKYTTEDFNLSERHKKAFSKICEFINLYADNQKEYAQMCRTMYSYYQDYKIMANGGRPTLDVYEEPVKETVEEEVEEITVTDDNFVMCVKCEKEVKAKKDGDDLVCDECGELVDIL